MRRHFAVGFALVLAMSAPAHAHGINGHMYVTDRAIDLLPDGELKAMLSDPSVRPAAQIGALFPDTGYAASAPYGEPAHWEPFATAAISYLRETFGPAPYEGENAKVVAFFLGVLTHGMEDEIFDSLFLPAAEENDNESQDILDTACDTFLVASGKTDLDPPAFIPYEHVIEVFARMGVTATQAEMDSGMDTVKRYAIGALKTTATDLARGYSEQIPWSFRHYNDPATGGAFAHEMDVIAPFLEYSWRRLQRTVAGEEAFISRFPREGEPLSSVVTGTTASWAALFSGLGIDDRDITAERITLSGGGNAIPADVGRTHWSNGQGQSRLFIVKPGADLMWDTAYTVEVAPGLRIADGRTLQEPYSFEFTTACGPDGGVCRDAGSTEDAAPSDAAPPDPGADDSAAGCSCAILSLKRDITVPELDRR